jgi:hypothetical protein
MRAVAVLFFVAASIIACSRLNPDFAPDAVADASAGPGPLPDASHPGGADLSTHPHPSPDLAAPPDLAKPVGVVCGTQTCAPPAFCCVSTIGRACVDPGLTACVGGSHVTCDGPEDCDSGHICCGSITGSSCAAACIGSAPLCHTTADCTGTVCCPTQFGYSICRFSC